MHFCIQVADVDLDATVLPDATATSGMFDIDDSPNPTSKTQGQLVGVGKVWTGEKKIQVKSTWPFFAQIFFCHPFRILPTPTNCPWVSEDAPNHMIEWSPIK